MENQPNRVVTIAIVTGIIALLFGLCAGALVGGLGGYALGRQAAARTLRNFAQPQPFGPSQRITPAPLPGGQGSQGSTTDGSVIVQGVVAGSPAAQAGIQPGDVITKVDNTTLDANTRLADVIAQYKPGDQVKMTIERQGSERTVQVKMGSFPGEDQRPYLGIRYSQPAIDQATPTP
jgi:putative serine protease PepD